MLEDRVIMSLYCLVLECVSNSIRNVDSSYKSENIFHLDILLEGFLE